MSTNLITGYAGKSHITSAGDGAVNAAILGTGRYVLDVAEKFAYELISNNQIRIKSGYAIDQGRKIELAVNDYEELIIDNGLQGVKRCDLVAITYEKNLETGIETATMNIIKGTSGDDYIDPEHTSGDIIVGDVKDDFLLYRLKINGLSIEAVEPLFKVRKSFVEMDTAENTTAFTSSDVADGSASSWTSVSKLSSDEKHSSIFAKMSQMFKNVRYLYKMLGTTDISKIGNGTCTGAISSLNDGLANKSYIKIIKGDWSGLMGTLTPLFDTSDKVINLIAHNELNDTYPAVRVGRADADHDGNDIPTTYLKKADAKTMFNTGYRQVSSNEFDKYFSDTWSYAGADGLSIDSGTWLVNYYCWVSESSAVDVISLKSTVDQAIGITAPNNGNGGTWLTMHEIISGKAVNNLKFLIKVPKAVTFGQISTKITAIKLC